MSYLSVISNINWQLDDNFKFGIEQSKYLVDSIKENTPLPVPDNKINFADNRWDFRPYSTLMKSDSMVFNFNDIHETYRNILKYFILNHLLNGNGNGKNKIQTINRRFYDIKAFLRWLYENDIYDLIDVDLSVIQSYFSIFDKKSLKSITMVKTALNKLFLFLSTTYEYTYESDIKDFLSNKGAQKLLDAIAEENKTPDIPIDYFNKLLATLIKVMNDVTATYTDRSIACVYILLSQTGLRINEILLLETTDISDISLPNLKVKTNFLNYKSSKGAKGDNEYIEGKIYINELSKKAFDMLTELGATYRNKYNTNLLFVPEKKCILPAAPRVSLLHFKKFVSKYGSEFDAFNTSNKYPDLCHLDFSKANINRTQKDVSFPSTIQFRVHVCTELYNKGVPLSFIRKYLCHLTDSMEGYYVRPKLSNPQEDIAYSEKIIKEIVTNEATLIGNDSSEITNKINKFLQDNNFNIEKDLNTIIENLKGKLAIRAKPGGVCIKTSIRDCLKENSSNEIYCAYDVCPNIFHMYYMIPESYSKFKDLQKTHKYNLENGYLRQADKELNKLKYILNKKLLPEMNDLKERLDSKGVQSIIDTYPELIDIISSFDNIMEEINLWMNK